MENDFVNQSFAADGNSLDLDMPNFNPTKYNKMEWRVSHSIFYFLFSSCLLASYILKLIDYIQDKKNTAPDKLMFPLDKEHFKYILLGLAGCFYLISSFLEWTHFRRGCLGLSNLNSNIKTNRDMSVKARFQRAKTGFMYFLCVISSLLIILSSLSIHIGSTPSSP
mgnify:CR=1 FL=1